MVLEYFQPHPPCLPRPRQTCLGDNTRISSARALAAAGVPWSSMEDSSRSGQGDGQKLFTVYWQECTVYVSDLGHLILTGFPSLGLRRCTRARGGTPFSRGGAICHPPSLDIPDRGDFLEHLQNNALIITDVLTLMMITILCPRYQRAHHAAHKHCGFWSLDAMD